MSNLWHLQQYGNPFTNTQGEDSKGVYSTSLPFQSPSKISISATGKINFSKETGAKNLVYTSEQLHESQEDHEAIPAATYQPQPLRPAHALQRGELLPLLVHAICFCGA